jgi:hypothetical protein
MRLELNITCSYSVNLTLDIPDDVPEDIAKRLVEIEKRDQHEIDPDRDSDVDDWLNINIEERDAYNWKYTLNEAKILPDNDEEGGQK